MIVGPKPGNVELSFGQRQRRVPKIKKRDLRVLVLLTGLAL